jgi:hypothetical protein
MKEYKNITSTKTFERIKQYKVDFAYSKNLFYSATNRINQEEKKYLKSRKRIDVAILVFTLLSFSSAIYPKASILLLGIFAFMAFGLSIFQFINIKDFSKIKDYKKTADSYLTLHKTCKNLITKAEDNIISINNLSIEIDKIQSMQNKLIETSPKTEDNDYFEAKKQIEEGNFEYTKKEIEIT